MQAAVTNRYSRIGMIVAVVLLTVGGPFGTLSFSPGQRLVYWAAMIVASYVVGTGAAAYFLELLAGQIAQRWPRLIVGALLTSLPVTIVVLLVNGIARRHMDVSEALGIWLDATLVTLAVVLALVSLRAASAGAAGAIAAESGPAPAPPAAAPQQPAILERVPLPQRGRLLALIVEDHYVDIVTDRGKALVLMRLADAMRETGDVPGLQIHRSHWVARDAVVQVRRSEGKLLLELSNGLCLPVSRGFLPAVKAAGLVA
jgi:DNA-binding LytR/AlgR family response regulator